MGHAPVNLIGSAAAARLFVDELELPRPIRVVRGVRADQTIQDQFELTENQAFVVGSEIVSFVSGLTPHVREVIVNSSLLAQLAANRRVPTLDRTRAWYEAYFDTLVHLGWAIQERGFSEHREAGQDFDAHEAILSVAEVILGPGTAALKVVASTLLAMKKLSDGRWITIFKRESQSARAARFQITVAEPKLDGGTSVSLMAFELNPVCARKLELGRPLPPAQ